MSESAQISFLGSSKVYLETFFDLYRLGVSIPPCRTKPDFVSSQITIAFHISRQKSDCARICSKLIQTLRNSLNQLKTPLEDRLEPPNPMSQIARTLLSQVRKYDPPPIISSDLRESITFGAPSFQLVLVTLISKKNAARRAANFFESSSFLYHAAFVKRLENTSISHQWCSKVPEPAESWGHRR